VRSISERSIEAVRCALGSSAVRGTNFATSITLHVTLCSVRVVCTRPIDVAEQTENKSLSSSSDSSTLSGNASLGKITHYGETAAVAIEYLAGWVAYKFKSTHPSLGIFTYESKQEHGYSLPSWVGHLSFGGLKKPSPEWLHTAILLDKIFNKYHKHKGADSTNVPISLRKGKGLVSNLVKKIVRSLGGKLSSDIITTFIKQRTMIRLNYLNYIY
jgi:hypothetical protein